MKNSRVVITRIADKEQHIIITPPLIEVTVTSDRAGVSLIIEEVAHVEEVHSPVIKDRLTEEEETIEVGGYDHGYDNNNRNDF